jgi:hypothetical protein
VDDIRICAEARAIIGGGEWRPGDGGYKCLRCGRPGEPTIPTSLVLLVYRDGGYPSVSWAHAGCVPSVVVQASGRLMIGASANPGEDFLRVRAAILERGPGGQAWPALLHEFARVGQLVPLPPTDPDVARLLADGLTLLAGGNALADLSLAPGWRLELREARARLAAPNGTVYYEGRWNAPAGWEDLASERGGCLLLAGIVGLFRRRAMSAPARTLSRRLGQAARAGTVAGGLVPVAR